MPGISYLATSPVYFEMQDALKKTRKKVGLSTGSTRRQITENKITQNIMNFNQPTILPSYQDMELSSEYHTQVNTSRFN